MHYDIIVVGGGHAGIESAYASSTKGHNTLLITGNIDDALLIKGFPKWLIPQNLLIFQRFLTKLLFKSHLPHKKRILRKENPFSYAEKSCAVRKNFTEKSCEGGV